MPSHWAISFSVTEEKESVHINTDVADEQRLGFAGGLNWVPTSSSHFMGSEKMLHNIFLNWAAVSRVPPYLGRGVIRRAHSHTSTSSRSRPSSRSRTGGGTPSGL